MYVLLMKCLLHAFLATACMSHLVKVYSVCFHPFSRYYEQDLALAKDLQDKLAQAKAYCNLGLAHKALGEHKKAEECQRYLLSLAQALDNTQVTFCTASVFTDCKNIPLHRKWLLIMCLCLSAGGVQGFWEPGRCVCVSG